MSKNSIAQSKNDMNEYSKNFYIEQIKTTKRIINEFSNSKEFSSTMLINSLLSLVVLPCEKAKKNDGNRIFSGTYKDLEKRVGSSPTIFVPIKSCKDGKPKFENKTIYSYIRKFRNGIAHQNLEVNVDPDRNIRIKIYNKFSCNDCKKCKGTLCKEKGLVKKSDSVIDFQMNLTVKQLQKLSLYIADSYLKSIE